MTIMAEKGTFTSGEVLAVALYIIFDGVGERIFVYQNEEEVDEPVDSEVYFNVALTECHGTVRLWREYGFESPFKEIHMVDLRCH